MGLGDATQLTTATTPLVRPDGTGGHAPVVSASPELSGSAVSPANPLPTREVEPSRVQLLILRELRRVATLLAIAQGSPALFEPLPELDSLTIG